MRIRVDEPIISEPHWALTPSLQPYLLAAGLLSATDLVILILADLFSVNETMSPLLRTLPFQIFGAAMGATGAVGAILLWRSMGSYWWQVDRRERGTSILWLLALSVGSWIGATVYYFVVFRRVGAKRSIRSTT
jgi:hypothetical protein